MQNTGGTRDTGGTWDVNAYRGHGWDMGYTIDTVWCTADRASAKPAWGKSITDSHPCYHSTGIPRRPHLPHPSTSSTSSTSSRYPTTIRQSGYRAPHPYYHTRNSHGQSEYNNRLTEARLTSAPQLMRIWAVSTCPLKAVIHNADAPSFSLIVSGRMW